MKKTENVQDGKNGMTNMPDKSALPKTNENDIGVKAGVGIPNTSGSTSNNTNHSGKNTNRHRPFSNERPIF